jgi:hypothetical protein
MKQHSRLALRLAAGLVSLALAGGWAANAQAQGIAYAFGQETISGVSITPLTTLVSGVDTSTQASATRTIGPPVGAAFSDPLDTPQAYLGGAPASPPNNFTRYAPGSPPVSPTTPASFTRSDAQIVSLAAATNTASTVAESFLNVVGRETAQSGVTAAVSLLVPTSTALTIAYTFANRAAVFVNSGNNATASYQFNITIRDAAGTVVFNSNTANTNLTLAAPPPVGVLSEIIRSGTESVVTPVLTGGATYNFTFSIASQTSVAVPEPDAVTLVAASGALTLAVGAVRRRRLRRATK